MYNGLWWVGCYIWYSMCVCVCIYTVCQKISWIYCTVVSLLQWNLARDILMTLAIKRIHNLQPHLSYVSTLPDITQNQHTALTSWSRGSLTLGIVFSGHHRRSQWQIWLHTRVKAKGRHFEYLLWFSNTTGSEPLQTYWNRFFPELLTILRGRQHNSSISFA